MKQLFGRIADKGEQLLEISVIAAAAIAPSLIDVQSVIAASDRVELDLLSLLTYYAAKFGNPGIGVFLAAVAIAAFRKANSKRVINRGPLYHEHGMLWYRFCSKVLGYGMCSLVRVPIATQFKLILDDTFDKYDLGEIEEEDDEDAEIEVSPPPNTEGFPSSSNQAGQVNLLISDTYSISSGLLPDDCRENAAVVVRRLANEASFARRYSPKLVDGVTNVVRNLPQGSHVNVFATTNPRNTYEIVNKVFKTGGRDNINALYVYKQQDGNSEDPRKFVEAIKIYDQD